MEKAILTIKLRAGAAIESLNNQKNWVEIYLHFFLFLSSKSKDFGNTDGVMNWGGLMRAAWFKGVWRLTGL